MIVLSLFDGMSTGQLALKNVGIPVEKYYASEIKPYAIKLTQHHFPKTIQLGDVRNWKNWDIEWDKIDLILSGSPCQDLSSAGKRNGITGKNSSLFFVFVDILNHVKSLNPNVKFLQENVASARKEDVRIISESLGIYPVMIDSALLTAQSRKRLYWSNIRVKKYGLFGEYITDIPQPKDLGIKFQDIVESGVVDRIKAFTLLERYGQQTKFKNKSKKYINNYLYKRGVIKYMDNYVQENDYYRPLTQTEMERLQGFPDGYTSNLSREQAGSLLGDGWTLPVIEHIFKFLKQ